MSGENWNERSVGFFGEISAGAWVTACADVVIGESGPVWKSECSSPDACLGE